MAGGWGGSQVVGISTLGSRVAPPAGRPQDDIQPSEQTETSSDGTFVDQTLWLEFVGEGGWKLRRRVRVGRGEGLEHQQSWC